MSYVFTDYNQMVGKRPRELYWKELQDAIIEVNRRLDSEVSEIAPTIIDPIPGYEPITIYPTGITTFQITEVDSTGYPSLDGLVETVYIDNFRNIQHFFEYTDDDKAGSVYHRQWKPAINQWTAWDKILTREAIQAHASDSTLHITNKDRQRLDGYIHYQPASQTQWTITHNLNKFPQVQVVDSGGNVVQGDIKHISKYELTISFSSPFTGNAYLS
jgi:hypothetical protein